MDVHSYTPSCPCYPCERYRADNGLTVNNWVTLLNGPLAEDWHGKATTNT